MKKLLVLTIIVLALTGLLVFTACSPEPEPEPDITLSGTITVKQNGQTVPGVLFFAHDNDWGWSKSIWLDTSDPDVPWSITIRPFSEETEIFFRVEGFDEEDGNSLFSLDVRDLSKRVYKSSINNITINMEDLKTITLSGTISGSYDGNPVTTMFFQANSRDEYGDTFIGQTSVSDVGTDRPWSMVIPAFDTETEIMFLIWGFNGDTWVDQLFFKWDANLGVELKVKDIDINDIALTYHALRSVTLSGTINISYNGQPVPSVGLQVHDHDKYWDGSYLGGTDITRARNTPWSVTIEGFAEDTLLTFYIFGYNSSIHTPETYLFECRWEENDVIVKNQSISNIVLNVGNIQPITLSGTINVSYNGDPVNYVQIRVVAYDENDEDDDMDIGGAEITMQGNNTPWSITFARINYYSDNRSSIRFRIWGYLDKDNQGDTMLFGGKEYFPNPAITDKNTSGIVLNLGNIVGP